MSVVSQYARKDNSQSIESMKDKIRYYEIARGSLSDLLDEINTEVRNSQARLVSIIVLTDEEFENRQDDAAWERERLKELEAKRESIVDEADGRLLTREEWDELDGVFPGTTNWDEFDPSNLGPYVAVLERVAQGLRKNDEWPDPDLDGDLSECESKPRPDPNIDDEIPF